VPTTASGKPISAFDGYFLFVAERAGRGEGIAVSSPSKIWFVAQALRDPPDVSGRVTHAALPVAVGHVGDIHDVFGVAVRTVYEYIWRNYREALGDVHVGSPRLRQAVGSSAKAPERNEVSFMDKNARIDRAIESGGAFLAAGGVGSAVKGRDIGA
jgi:hypothetical protein